MLTGLVLALWIGVADLSINPEESFDIAAYEQCEVDILCRAAIPTNDLPIVESNLEVDSPIGDWLSGMPTLGTPGLLSIGPMPQFETNSGGPWPPPTWSGPDPSLAVLESTSGELYVGIDDQPSVGGGPDYDDAVQRVYASSVQTPEPGSLLLLGTGLVALARVARRRRAVGR